MSEQPEQDSRWSRATTLAGSLTLALGALLLATAAAGPAGAQEAEVPPGLVVDDAGGFRDRLQDLVVLPDGRLVAAATEDGRARVDRIVLVAYRPDGSRDTAFGDLRQFGDLGELRIPITPALDFAARDVRVALGVLPNGNIALAASSTGDGTATPTNIRVVQPDGTPEPTFGVKGVAKIGGGDRERVTGLATLPDGRIAVSRANPEAATSSVLVLTPTGALDDSFSNEGIARLPAGVDGVYTDLVVRPDTGVVAVGRTAAGELLVVAYDPDGSFDADFGGDGVVTTDLGVAPEEAGDGPAAALAPDGRLVVAGSRVVPDLPTGVPDEQDVVVLVYRPDGSLDADFGDDGVVTTDLSPSISSFDAASDVIVGPTGAVTVVGTTRRADGDADLFVLRYDPEGAPATGFGQGDARVVLEAGLDERGEALVALPGGGLVAGGSLRGEELDEPLSPLLPLPIPPVRNVGEILLFGLQPDGTPAAGFGPPVDADLGLTGTRGLDLPAPRPLRGATLQGAEAELLLDVSRERAEALGIERVRLFVDGMVAGGQSDFPYDFRVYPALQQPGRHDATVLIETASGTLARAATYTVTGQLKVSSRPTRTPSRPLEGATLPDTAFVFLDVAEGSRVRSVRFLVDGEPVRRERLAPYDLGGTSGRRGFGGLLARPFDTGTLEPGEHTVTAEVVLDAPTGPSEVTTSATFTVGSQPRQLELLVSEEADRDPARMLGGATLDGDEYVFVETDEVTQEVERVRFFIDGRPLFRDERLPPFDLGGNRLFSSEADQSRELRLLAPGLHTLTAQAELADGTLRELSATFRISG